MRLLWQMIPSTVITEMLCKSGLDGVVLDLEHGVFGDETLYSCIQVATLCGKEVLVRFADLELGRIRMCLDAGATGIIMSTVEHPASAEELLKVCKYEYSRGQGLVRENAWGELSLPETRGARDRSVKVIPQIETVTAVDRIADLVRDDFDYYMVGPYDLSASLGRVGDFKSPGFLEAMDRLREVCGDKLGYHIVKDIRRQLKVLGDCEFLAFGLDAHFIMDGAKQIKRWTS